MSSIVLSGDTSGTVTVAVPAVAGTNTVTIPAVTGTAVVSGQNSAITNGTAVASTSGTSIDFNNIPSWVKRITVMFNGVSTNGSSDILVRTGAGSISSSGYSSSVAYWSNGSSATYATNSTGFRATATSPPQLWYGAMVITLVNPTTYLWSETVSFTDGATYQINGSGGNTLSGILDRVRITTANGTDSFDAGTINILYE